MTTPKEQEEQTLERSAPQTEVEVTMTDMAKTLAPQWGQNGVLMEILHQRRQLRRRVRLR